MSSVDPNVYDAHYYLQVCLGSEEFKKSGGKQLHPSLEILLGQLRISASSRVLDVGCGRGDITLFLGRKAKEAVGIDYAKAAIALANSAKEKFPEQVQKRVRFALMNTKALAFPDNYFDVIVCIDVLEHLYRDEAELAMAEMTRVLKKDGMLFVHTGTNRLLYDYTYKYYTYPLNRLLTKADQLLRSVRYDPLPRDPRNAEEKVQHVNEPTYFYLKGLFSRFHLTGRIQTEIGYIKPVKQVKTRIYNAVIALYPLSILFPLNLLFGCVFIARMRNRK